MLQQQSAIPFAPGISKDIKLMFSLALGDLTNMKKIWDKVKEEKERGMNFIEGQSRKTKRVPWEQTEFLSD